MRKIVLIIWFLLAANFLIAQDTLYKENGSKLVVKIIDQNVFQVKYRILNNPDSLIYVIHKDDVKEIVHEDGKKEFYPKSANYINRSENLYDKNYNHYVHRNTRNKQEPKKFSKKYYYVNITETNFIFSKAYYEDWLLLKGRYKFSMGLQVINGMRFCKNHFIGLGFGLNTSLISHHAKGTLTGMPFFVDYRYYILKIKPQIYGNLAAGVFKSGNIFHFRDVNYLPFINPSLGISFRISQRVYGNFSLGYTVYIHKATLYTTNGSYYPDYYFYPIINTYSYHKHLVWNNKNCFNVKFGFVF